MAFRPQWRIFRLPSFRFHGTFRTNQMPGYFALVFSITLVGVGLAVTRPYLSLYLTNQIHTSPVELGAFMCTNGIGGIIASTWLGKKSDTGTPKKFIILLSCLSAGCGYACFLFMHNYIQLLIFTTFLLGMGAAAFPQLFAYARESAIASTTSHPARTIASLRAFFSFAWVVGPLFGAWGLSLLGYNGLFMSTSLIYFLIFGVALLSLQRRQHTQIPKIESSTLWKNLQRREIFYSIIAFVFASTASSVNGMYMPLFVTRTIGAQEHVVGWVFSLSAGLEIPIMIGLSAVSEKIEKRKILLFGIICGILYYTGVIFTDAAWQMLILQVFCAIFIAIISSTGMSYFQDFMPESAGSATTLFSNTNNIGSVAGSLLGGTIAQTLGFRAVYESNIGLALFAFFLLYLAKKRQPLKHSETNMAIHPSQSQHESVIFRQDK
ncbi:MFS transporter [Alicyclobacillus sp. TC]|nr:MFS transporter [Alicyclobacillus sp. TC]